MFTVLEHPSPKSYLEKLQGLVKFGARRFLLHGLSPETIEVFRSARKNENLPELHIEICSIGTGEADVPLQAISRQAAYAQPWDAIFVFQNPEQPGIPAELLNIQGRPQIVYNGKRAEGVVVVSIPKSGTHLISRVMQKLGYDVQGQGGRNWSREERQHTIPLWAAKLGQLPELCSAEGYGWLHRYMKLITSDAYDENPAWPTNGCVMLHELVLNRIDGEFYRAWERTNHPRMIFNYRDPRAVLSSFTHFLTSGRFAATPEQLAHSAILKQIPDLAGRLLHAIKDDTFPRSSIFRDSTWLLRHPLVCNISYEQLVGSHGGGSDEAQWQAIARIMCHLEVGGDPQLVADELFDTQSGTFFRGRTDAWKDEFTPQHLREFNRKHRGVLEDYGYDVLN